MISNIAPLENPFISIKPSDRLKNYIKKIDVVPGLPPGISSIIFKNPAKQSTLAINLEYKLTSHDRDFIKSITSSNKNNFTKMPLTSCTADTTTAKLLGLQDLTWLYDYINENNKNSQEKVYLHELLEGSEIILPKNKEVPRNPELESRCQKLKAEQENKVYNDMTKNVDNVRKRYPEDTIAFQSE